MVGLLHGLDLVQTVLIGIADGLERAAAGSQHRAAPGQDSLEVPAVQDPEMAVDQALVAVLEAVEFYRLAGILRDGFVDTAHSRVQCLAVAAAGEHTDT